MAVRVTDCHVYNAVGGLLEALALAVLCIMHGWASWLLKLSCKAMMHRCPVSWSDGSLDDLLAMHTVLRGQESS